MRKKDFYGVHYLAYMFIFIPLKNADIFCLKNVKMGEMSWSVR
jgi:hypothetical protein